MTRAIQLLFTAISQRLKPFWLDKLWHGWNRAPQRFWRYPAVTFDL